MKLQKSPKPIKYLVGSTARINVTCVNDNSCGFILDTPERLLEFWKTIISEQPDHQHEKENVVVVMLNTRMRPYAWHLVSIGTVNECSAHPREILRPVVASGAYGFAMMHNHPSGDPSPSRSDESMTRRIIEASQLLQIRLIDHMIVGRPALGRSEYYSFREAGIVP